jgi:hypothetical protein
MRKSHAGRLPGFAAVLQPATLLIPDGDLKLHLPRVAALALIRAADPIADRFSATSDLECMPHRERYGAPVSSLSQRARLAKECRTSCAILEVRSLQAGLGFFRRFLRFPAGIRETAPRAAVCLIGYSRGTFWTGYQHRSVKWLRSINFPERNNKPPSRQLGFNPRFMATCLPSPARCTCARQTASANSLAPQQSS